jgi:ADP-heptose:LPS heptosyltransferase/SAM-dependent methyltransferase
MVWHPETSQGHEVKKVRPRVLSYCQGLGIDIGCGPEKITKKAIGVDAPESGADVCVDLSDTDALSMFADGSFDYVFSSHCLEDFALPEPILAEWWRLVKPGGVLILYGPDPDFYPKVGTAGANPNHKLDMYWPDVWRILKKFGNAKKVHGSRHNESNEYSWLLVVRKTAGILKRPLEFFLGHEPQRAGEIVFPRAKKAKKEALVIRYGALGDAIWATPVLEALKADGYYIVYNTTPYAAQVLKHNPNIDEFLIQDPGAVPDEDLEKYWSVISEGFDKVVNMSGAVEGRLLVREGSEEFQWSDSKRRRECNKNYLDESMAWAGYPEKTGAKMTLHFTEQEEALAQSFRSTYRDKFIILWSLAGSSFHKLYPWAPQIGTEVVKRMENAMVITVGDNLCRMLEWDAPDTLKRSGCFTVRQSMILTKYCDLVVGPETGILNAAACYDTPKIVFMSHSSPTNLTRDWKNCIAMSAKDCKCQPCHKLIFSNDHCPRGKKEAAATACMDGIDPFEVLRNINSFYGAWNNETTQS